MTIAIILNKPMEAFSHWVHDPAVAGNRIWTSPTAITIGRTLRIRMNVPSTSGTLIASWLTYNPILVGSELTLTDGTNTHQFPCAQGEHQFGIFLKSAVLADFELDGELYEDLAFDYAAVTSPLSLFPGGLTRTWASMVCVT